MTGAELRAAREGLALPRAALAEELGVPEQQVWDWESGVARIPSRSAALVAYKAALARREAAMESSGLPACTFVREWNAEPMPPGTEPQLRRLEALARHARTCPTCVARDLHARRHLPPLPRRPSVGPVGAVGWVWDRIETLPAWARPPVAGGVIVAATVLARAAVLLLLAGPSMRLLWLVAGGALAGVYLGAVGGAAYALVRRPARRLGRAGDYVTGIACVAAYLLAVGLPMALVFRHQAFRSPSTWAIFAVMSVVFGSMAGQSWFRTR